MGNHRGNPNWKGSPPPRPNGPPGGPNVNFQINPHDLRRHACKECRCTNFVPQFNLFEVPMILRLNPGMDLLQVQTWACRQCGLAQVVPEMQLLPSLRSMEAEGAQTVETMPESDLKPEEKPNIVVVGG